jgi:hypothetical protein
VTQHEPNRTLCLLRNRSGVLLGWFVLPAVGLFFKQHGLRCVQLFLLAICRKRTLQAAATRGIFECRQFCLGCRVDLAGQKVALVRAGALPGTPVAALAEASICSFFV